MPTTREQWYEYISKKYPNHPAFSADNVESATGNEPVGKEEVSRLHPPVRIHVHSKRHRLCDADGISAKAVIDAVVLSGLLPDDSPEYVKEVSYSQEKISNKEDEQTEIIIEEVG